MSTAWLYLSSIGLTYASAVIPWFLNSELIVLSMSALLTSRPALAGLILTSAIGQTAGNVTLYWGGTRAGQVPTGKVAKAIERWRHRFERSGPGVLLLLVVSATVGVPPFYVISILSGTFRVNIVAFVLISMFGRVVRYSLVVFFPRLVIDLWR